FIIGGVAGVLVVLSVFFFDRIKIDDPVGAISVHGTCGAWGLISVGLFSDGTYGSGWDGVRADTHLRGAGAGGTGPCSGDASQLAAQAIETVVGVGWNVLAGGVIFYLIGKLIRGNRVSAEVEVAGLDVPEMGVPGYPEFLRPTPVSDLPASAAAAVSTEVASTTHAATNES